MSTIDYIADIDVSAAAAWLNAIPTEEWPSMADIDWHGGRQQLQPLVASVMAHFGRCDAMGFGFFLLAPGQAHPMHTDIQPPEWLTRVHVPIITNPLAVVVTDEGTAHMEAGRAYRFDTRRNHAVSNGGTAPRVHFILDIKRGTHQ